MEDQPEDSSEAPRPAAFLVLEVGWSVRCYLQMLELMDAAVLQMMLQKLVDQQRLERALDYGCVEAFPMSLAAVAVAVEHKEASGPAVDFQEVEDIHVPGSPCKHRL